MPTIFDAETLNAVTARVAALTPQHRAAWGKMDAPRMVAHLVESGRMALGELPVAPRALPIRYFPLNWLIIHWLPFPKGAPTAPELIARVPATWADDVARLADVLRRVSAKGPGGTWPAHPAFGNITGTDWGVLVFRHTDHHLRQFRV